MIVLLAQSSVQSLMINKCNGFHLYVCSLFLLICHPCEKSRQHVVYSSSPYICLPFVIF